MSGKGGLDIKDTAAYRRLLKKREKMTPEQRAFLDMALSDLELAAMDAQSADNFEGLRPGGQIVDIGDGIEDALTDAFVSPDVDFYNTLLGAMGIGLVDEEQLYPGGSGDDLHPIQ